MSMPTAMPYKTFNLVVNYLKAGGNPQSPFVVKFCQEHQIRQEDFVASVVKDSTTITEKLRKAGLLLENT